MKGERKMTNTNKAILRRVARGAEQFTVGANEFAVDWKNRCLRWGSVYPLMVPFAELMEEVDKYLGFLDITGAPDTEATLLVYKRLTDPVFSRLNDESQRRDVTTLFPARFTHR